LRKKFLYFETSPFFPASLDKYRKNALKTSGCASTHWMDKARAQIFNVLILKKAIRSLKYMWTQVFVFSTFFIINVAIGTMIAARIMPGFGV